MRLTLQRILSGTRRRIAYDDGSPLAVVVTALALSTLHQMKWMAQPHLVRALVASVQFTLKYVFSKFL
jgi:hypothetical protein